MADLNENKLHGILEGWQSGVRVSSQAKHVGNRPWGGLS